jgi:uncharacterized membrane protein YjjB (DUF3815 family)
MFSMRKRVAFAAGIIGMLANVARLVLIDSGMPSQAGTALAALFVGLLAAAASNRLVVPRITLSVPAVVIMVPGSAAYRALVYLNTQHISEAINNGITAVFVGLSIGVGLALARILTDPEWAYEK